MLVVFPFLVQFDIRFNILRLKGVVIIKLFNKIKFEVKIRIKHGYVYINHKNRERKEKLTDKNINIMFFLNLLNQIYFREQFLEFNVFSNFGYINNSCTTAVGCGLIDVLFKTFMGKLKNNKKTAHIFVAVEPKYNEDIFNMRVNNIIRISIFDIAYAFIVARIHVWQTFSKQKAKQ